MKTATKSSWSEVAQDLDDRWFLQENMSKKKENKQALKWQSVSSVELLFSTQFKTSFWNFQTSLNNTVKPAKGQGKHKILFCGVFFFFFCTSSSSKKLLLQLKVSANKKVLWAAWSQDFDQLSQLGGDKLCSGLSLLRLRLQRVQGAEDLA